MIELINRHELNNDDLGYVEMFDFSKSNISQSARIEAITTIASVCYENPKAIGSIKLYDRLSRENKGLPSSSFEFVPMLLGDDQMEFIINLLTKENRYDLNCYKYGEIFEHNDKKYLLTNLRAVLNDVGPDNIENDLFFNTSQYEIDLIKSRFKVFKSHIDLSTRAQLVRHRTSFQELSRRYVSGKKKQFAFYVSKKMQDVNISFNDQSINMNNIIDMSIDFYNESINRGIKPEEARRILPQAMYTTIWTAWNPNYLEVFYKLRLDQHAQYEIRELATAMLALDNNM